MGRRSFVAIGVPTITPGQDVDRDKRADRVPDRAGVDQPGKVSRFVLASELKETQGTIDLICFVSGHHLLFPNYASSALVIQIEL